MGDPRLLQRAVGYALSAADAVAPDLLSRPTPCRRWDLGMLLTHTCESVAALQEGLDTGRIGLFTPAGDAGAADPVCFLRARLTRLSEAWSAACEDRAIAVADQRAPLSLVARVAAVEITVHAWDVLQAVGQDRPIPPDLAADLLVIALELVPASGRAPLFARPLRTAETASPGEALLAFLGRPSATVAAAGSAC